MVRLHAFHLARVAPLPAALQLELVDRFGHELLLNTHVHPDAASVLVASVLDGQLHPTTASMVPADSLDEHLTSLMSREVLHPASLEWIASHQMFDRDNQHWDRLVDVLSTSCDPIAAPLRIVGRTPPVDVAVKLVHRAPMRLRRKLVEHARLLDKVQVLCMEFRHHGAPTNPEADRIDAEFLIAGDTITEPIPPIDKLVMLATLCRARPALADQLSGHFVSLSPSAASWSPQTVTLLAWTVPWRRSSGHADDLAARLERLAEASSDSLRPEIIDQLAVLRDASNVPHDLKRRSAAAIGHRRTPWLPNLECHNQIFSPRGRNLAADALTSRRTRASAKLIAALEAQLGARRSPPRPPHNAEPPIPRLTDVCGSSLERWRLAISLADGSLTDEQLADCVRCST